MTRAKHLQDEEQITHREGNAVASDRKQHQPESEQAHGRHEDSGVVSHL